MCSQPEGFCLLGIRVIWGHLLMSCKSKVQQSTKPEETGVGATGEDRSVSPEHIQLNTRGYQKNKSYLH